MFHPPFSDCKTLEEVTEFCDDGEHSGQDLIDLWVENQELKCEIALLKASNE